ncbi:MAG TPA: YHS domain-containing (seleno)protein [Thermohalobaculum sp.]|nr:YHS domain-containing (seleno)protein [Thermohalobaculum sp.]
MPRLSRRNLLIGAGAAGVAAVAVVLAAGPKEFAAGPVFTEDGLAIRGYDPVAYFTEGAPVPGDPAHTAEWRGAVWRFASAGNRDRFLAEPERYAPAFGGYCAWAVAAKGALYSTQPSNWTIHEGRLFLNYNDDIQARFETDIPGFVAEADRRWPAILAEG